MKRVFLQTGTTFNTHVITKSTDCHVQTNKRLQNTTVACGISG